ncbi:hypothetical protein [Arthrobacter sp. JSM 101049]|uniref:hypothetical protein n=1 Tax=Arthrobacter sp. JSM 101049 TaxID=929097 RepID=UPI00356B05DB
MTAPRPDDLLELDLSAASAQYAPLSAPVGAVWPRAVVRYVDGWWAAKVWQSPGVPARRQGLLLAGQFSDRAKAFEFASHEVGVLRFTQNVRAVAAVGTASYAELMADWEAERPNPKQEPPC